jgi:hypothetical protein
MPQFGGMHIPHPLGGDYSSWVSHRYNRAPLVFVCGGQVLVVCGRKKQVRENVLEKCSVIHLVVLQTVAFLLIRSNHVFHTRIFWGLKDQT